MKSIIADGGNTKWKIRAPGANEKYGKREDQFDHFFVQLSRADYDRIEKRKIPDAMDDMFIVNGTPYMIGGKAVRHGDFELRRGEARYRPDYYGVLAAIAMARCFGQSTTSIMWVGMLPPKDVSYIDDLMCSVVGNWDVVWRGESFGFNVVDAITIDEPIGGWSNAVLRGDGEATSRRSVDSINNGITLVIDVGGYTTDAIVIDPNGEIDLSSARSEKIGVLDSVRDFTNEIRSIHARDLKGVDLDPLMVHEAVRTGSMNLRGLGVIGCEREAYETRRALVAKVENFYDQYGGAAQFDTILLTGGGSALLEQELRHAIRHNNIVLADRNARELHMANVRGAEKWYAFLKRHGGI